ncbi:MAG: hypothetical protein HOV87_01850, partial [Catenulispora sp.]|nr:hypothetical protein [Catenulispora sp.]
MSVSRKPSIRRTATPITDVWGTGTVESVAVTNPGSQTGPRNAPIAG